MRWLMVLLLAETMIVGANAQEFLLVRTALTDADFYCQSAMGWGEQGEQIDFSSNELLLGMESSANCSRQQVVITFFIAREAANYGNEMSLFFSERFASFICEDPTGPRMLAMGWSVLIEVRAADDRQLVGPPNELLPVLRTPS